MRKLALAAAMAVVTLGAGLALSDGARAMPIGMPGSANVSNVDQVHWVCNSWGRCGWRPNYNYGGSYAYGPRYGYGNGYGYHGGWHRWHHWRRW